MSIFDDVSKFIETRLDEFLRNNPNLELQALLEQLREQEKDTSRLILALDQEKKRLETDILSLAQDIQTWHLRIQRAKTAGRLDLAQAAVEGEGSLLRQGNQLWGQMEGTKKRMVQAQELVKQIQQKQQEVEVKIAQLKASQKSNQTTSNWEAKGWDKGINYESYSRSADPLDAQFQRWELEEELEKLKRDMSSR